MSSLAKNTRATMIPALRYGMPQRPLIGCARRSALSAIWWCPARAAPSTTPSSYSATAWSCSAPPVTTSSGSFSSPLPSPAGRCRRACISWFGRRRAPRPGRCRGRRDRHGPRGSTLWGPAVFLPRPGRQSLELRQLRPLGPEPLGNRARRRKPPAPWSRIIGSRGIGRPNDSFDTHARTAGCRTSAGGPTPPWIRNPSANRQEMSAPGPPPCDARAGG